MPDIPIPNETIRAGENSKSPIMEKLIQIDSGLSELHETISRLQKRLSIVVVDVSMTSASKDPQPDKAETSEMESYLDNIYVGIMEADKRLDRLRNNLRL